MNTLTPLFNRAGELPADAWFQVVPRGEWPHTGESGKQRLQVIDDAALDAMVNSFKPKVLVDQEHFSYDSEKSSEAFGWIAEVQKRTDGLYGRIEWTDLGTTAIANKRYRFASPVWLPRDVQALDGNKVRPTRLDSVGLTNTPNMVGILPLTNREEFRRTDAADSNHNKNQAPMKNIAALLGLTAEASEDSILTAVNALKNRATSAETKHTEIAAERDELKNRVTVQDEEAIDAELDARDVEESKRTKLRPVLAAMKNRAERVEFLDEVIGAPGEVEAPAVTTPSGKPVLNRAAAKTPKPGAAKTGTEQEQAQAANAEVMEYKLANRCSYDQAYNAVRAKKPELFGLAKN
jgi:phage I-like protein